MYSTRQKGNGNYMNGREYRAIIDRCKAKAESAKTVRESLDWKHVASAMGMEYESITAEEALDALEKGYVPENLSDRVSRYNFRIS